jgi:hypothetical protein
VECGIRFFTDPRNAGRKDLRCPFGCRAEHLRREANKRSDRHLGTEYGRRQKAKRNRERRTQPARRIPEKTPPEPETPEDLGPDMIAHIRVVTSIIERRRVSRSETIELIAWVLSQRRMGRGPSAGYGAPQTRPKSRGG